MLDARTHTSSFVDRRFGETSTHLTPEEKALERFTAERQSRLDGGGKKSSRFNLEDGDDDDDSAQRDALTHGGQKLGFGDEDELEYGGWGGLGDAVAGDASSTNREPLLRRRMAQVANGNKADDDNDAEDRPEVKRTRGEIMEEVVAKSKAHKVSFPIHRLPNSRSVH